MRSTISWKLRKDLRRATATVCLVSGMLLSIPLYGQTSPAWTSASTFGGSGSDTGEAVKVDRNGNRYVTGEFSATAYFPLRAAAEMDDDRRAAQSASARRALTSGGGTDIFLAKYDRSGKLKWLTQAGGAGEDDGFDVAFDAARNVYVTGEFTNSATFHGINSTDQTVVGLGKTIFLAKYTPSGVLAWVQTGTATFDSINEGNSVAVEPVTGSIYVTGIGQGDTTFSSSNGTTHSVAGPGTWHMVLVKYDTAGNFQWGQSNQAEPNSNSRRVAVDLDNNVYATGWMEGRTTFHSNDGNDLTVDGFSGPVQTFPDYPGDAFVVKYDENGNVQWVNHIGGYKAIGTAIATSRDGRVSITGYIGNIANSLPEQAATIVTSQPGGNNINLGGGRFTAPYNKDVFFATYDDEGVLLDARRFGGVKDEGGTGIAYDRHSKLIVAGIFQHTIKIEGHTLTGKNSSNLFLAKFARDERRCVASGTGSDEQHASTADTLNWIKGADGPFIGTLEVGPRIGLTAQGNVLVTGAYQPAAQFDGFKLQSAGLQDGFLALLRGPEEDEHRRHDAEHFDQQ
jgi:hypothetical protein